MGKHSHEADWDRWFRAEESSHVPGERHAFVNPAVPSGLRCKPTV
jgi:hypothetical protein